MKIICGSIKGYSCGKDMGEKEPYDDPNISHGMCPECEAKFYLAKAEGKS